MNDKVLIKPQTIDTFLLLGEKQWKCNIKVTIKKGENENWITINNRDIFFDKDGNFSGDGIDLRPPKDKK